MDVVVISLEGKIKDIRYNIQAVMELTENPKFETLQIAYVKSDETYVIVIHEPNAKKNKTASDLISSDLHGDIMVFGKKNEQPNNISYDYLAASLIESMSIDTQSPVSDGDYDDYYDYYDYYSKGYDSC